MNNILSFILIIFFSLLFNAFTCQDTTLEHVTIFFRHGARSPSSRIYPTNPTKESYWAKYGGFHMVTGNGLKQCYDLGVYIKNYYRNFLAPAYERSRLYARSTDLDRTLVSALAFLSGLYQPNNELQWNPTILPNWLPIPVHTVNLSSDPLFNYDMLIDSKCEKYNYLKNQFLNSPEYQLRSSSNSEFIKKMANYSGITDLDYYKIWIISDNAINEIIEKIKQPSWVIENYDKIIEAKDYTYTTDFGSFDRARFYGANLLNEILGNLDKKISKNLTYQMSVYSNHDINLSGLASLLNFSWPLKEIPYGSAFAFELRKSNSNQNYYVQVLFKDNHHYANKSELVPVKLNKCKNVLCTIEEFRDLSRPSFFTDYIKECSISNSMNNLKIYQSFVFVQIIALYIFFQF